MDRRRKTQPRHRQDSGLQPAHSSETRPTHTRETPSRDPNRGLRLVVRTVPEPQHHAFSAASAEAPLNRSAIRHSAHCGLLPGSLIMRAENKKLVPRMNKVFSLRTVPFALIAFAFLSIAPAMRAVEALLLQDT